MVPEPELSVRLPEKLAAHRGVDPTELSPPVGDVIDVEALETLVTGGHGTAPTTVSFEYDALTVTVEGPGMIDISVKPTAPHSARPKNPSVAD